MENFPGIISLFLACIEFVLLINLLIFAKKNKVNKKIIGLVGLLFTYQLFEFVICYFGVDSHVIVYIAFVIISFLPPLLLNLVLDFRGEKILFQRIIFLPITLLLIYFHFIVTEFVVTRCTIMFAAYDIPSPDLYGLLYYLPVFISMILLIKMSMSEKYKRQKSNLIILNSGIVLAFIPTLLIVLLFPSLIEFIESFLCKSASIMALALTIFAMRNKEVSSNNE
ncbi:MAG: hypothetical protein ABFS12_00560 [Bacteroidota bacterium]